MRNVLREHPYKLVIATVALSLATGIQAASPWFMAQFVDEGLNPASRDAIIFWAVAMFAFGLLHPLVWAIGNWLMRTASNQSRSSILRNGTDHLNQIGTGIRGRISTGEMINLATEDAQFGSRIQAGIPVLLSTFMTVVTCTTLVWLVHPLLGLLIAGGSLAVAVICGPLLGKLQQRQSVYRQETGALTGKATDVVGGLRILRGIGGDSIFRERYRQQSTDLRNTGYTVAAAVSWVDAIRMALPVLLVAAVTWVSLHLAIAGTISTGGVVSAFAFSSIMIMASNMLITVSKTIVTMYVAAGRLANFQTQTVDIDVTGDVKGMSGDLTDPDTGLTIRPGKLTAIVSAETAPGRIACERLARHVDCQVTWGGQPLAEADLGEVRERVLLTAPDDYLFAGSLAETLRLSDEDKVQDVLDMCGAEDVYTSVGSTMEGQVDDGGRNLSGGQRQRLCLARAIAQQPEVLLAVEPTSAVDAHTEALISNRVAKERDGFTTVVATNSPLWLAQADEVAWLVDGTVHRVGTHLELQADAAYRALASHQEVA